jgi:hypothetical protein
MTLKIDKEKAKRIYDQPELVIELLEAEFGADCFRKKDFNEIKTFEDACKELDVNPQAVYFGNNTSDEIAYKKLKIVTEALNQGWTPDWSNTNQKKWYPYFVLSSGFGFSGTNYVYGYSNTTVGSRLCFESEVKARYAGNQFLQLYKEFLTITK